MTTSEEFAGISGQAEGLSQLPDGKFLPPMEMTCIEQDFREALAKHYGDRIMTIGRAAVLTRPHKGRSPCHYCGICHRGCISRNPISGSLSYHPCPASPKRQAVLPFGHTALCTA